MRSGIAIEAENLGKEYFIGSGSANKGLKAALRGLAPSLRKFTDKSLWALRGATFSISQGEAVGIIGHNGAGKSTLLKVLSRVTRPTEGRANYRGRLSTLLEVGTGFHPELTGRDNIYMSGTILGMNTAEIARKFDDIVAFSDIGDFLDTPVKRYSSGMYVRLAFAVAATLEPDILIVDEVLAVGDAAFQRKSLGRLNEASEKQGRTVLFVSHNLEAIRNFCKRVIVLEKGTVVFDGATSAGIEHYLRSIPDQIDVRALGLKDRLNRTDGSVRITNVALSDSTGRATWQVNTGDTVKLRLDYEVLKRIPDMAFLVMLRSAIDGQLIACVREDLSNQSIEAGQQGNFELELPDLALRPGELSLLVCLDRADHGITYDVIDANVGLPLMHVVAETTEKYKRLGIVSLDYNLARNVPTTGATA